MKRQKLDVAMLVLALCGLALSLYALSLHTGDGTSICNIGETFNCDKVNKSTWSVFLGVPVALLGALAFCAVFLLVLKKRVIKDWLAFTDRDFAQYFLLLIVVMVGFQVYLTIMEIFFIHAYCIVCLLSQLVVIVMAVLAWKEYRNTKK